MTSRRHMLKQLAILSGGLMMLPEVSVANGVKHPYSTETGKAMLTAFAATVVPGADAPASDFAGIFDEKIYGFKKFKWLLLTDLRNRSSKLYNNAAFHKLSRHQRHEVIKDALRSRGIMKRLYSGAIQITQIGFYSGYRLEPEGCSEIRFKSQFTFDPPSYAASEDYFGKSLTANGNLS